MACLRASLCPSLCHRNKRSVQSTYIIPYILKKTPRSHPRGNRHTLRWPSRRTRATRNRCSSSNTVLPRSSRRRRYRYFIYPTSHDVSASSDVRPWSAAGSQAADRQFQALGGRCFGKTVKADVVVCVRRPLIPKETLPSWLMRDWLGYCLRPVVLHFHSIPISFASICICTLASKLSILCFYLSRPSPTRRNATDGFLAFFFMIISLFSIFPFHGSRLDMYF